MKNDLNFYPTPAWATEALMNVEKFNGLIWEPACGDGAMAEVLKKEYRVKCTDIADYGYPMDNQIDFLKIQDEPVVDNIVTNPPFNLAEEFLFQSLKHARKIALLLRLAFLEGQRRKERIWDYFPPSHVYVFSKRITFYPPDVEVKGTGTTAYAWYVWREFGTFNTTTLGWI